MLDVIAGYDCNIKCDYCTITEEMRLRSLTTKELSRELVEGRRRGHTSVQFGGGEPTIRDDLLKLVRRARGLGYTTIKVQSNGLRYAQSGYVAALVRAGVDTFAVSVMSHDDDAYERVTGFPNAKNVVVAGLRNLSRHDVRVRADVIMKRDTYRHLAAVVDAYAPLGVRDFVLWLVSVTDRNAAYPESLVPVREMLPFIRAACERGDALGVSVRSRHIPRCMLPGLESRHLVDTLAEAVRVVTPDGAFDLRDSRISANTYLADCETCVARPSCAGARRDYLEQVGTDEIRPLS